MGCMYGHVIMGHVMNEAKINRVETRAWQVSGHWLWYNRSIKDEACSSH